MRRISNAVMPHGSSTLWGAIRRAYGATRDRVDGQGWTTPLVDDFFSRQCVASFTGTRTYIDPAVIAKINEKSARLEIVDLAVVRT